MILAVFRSRIRPDAGADYAKLASEMEAIARSLPGFISATDFDSGDGEHVSLHEWESATHLEAWRTHPMHLAVQARGRRDFYECYTLYVCDNPRMSRFDGKEWTKS
jgi:heme-degrading monooxygenase HmoA